MAVRNKRLSIETLIAEYGLAAVFLGAGIEGETMVLAGGLFAHEGMLSLPGAMIAAACGSFVADQLFFAAGRRFPTRDVGSYIVAQLVGAIVAAGLLYVIASGAPGFDLAKGFAANGYGEH